MTDEEFDAFLEIAIKELEAKQKYLTAEFAIGQYGRYFLDFDTGKIQFL